MSPRRALLMRRHAAMLFDTRLLTRVFFFFFCCWQSPGYAAFDRAIFAAMPRAAMLLPMPMLPPILPAHAPLCRACFARRARTPPAPCRASADALRECHAAIFRAAVRCFAADAAAVFHAD